MLKNDTLKNGKSRIGLYKGAPPGSKLREWLKNLFKSIVFF